MGWAVGSVVSYLSPEVLVPPDHPLRAIKRLTDAALDRLCEDFGALSATTGRPSVPPEKFAAGLIAAGISQRAVGAAVDAADRLQYAGSLAWRWMRRCGT
jgi:hypothetical protein